MFASIMRGTKYFTQRDRRNVVFLYFEEDVMEIEKVSLSIIREYEKNAKLHPKEQIEQIKKSILEFGNNDPIAIDENNVIIEGHGRYMALKQLGYEEVEVIKLTHLDEEQKKAYILAHNKLTMNTGFDLDVLQDELLDIESVDMSEFGFNLELIGDDGLDIDSEDIGQPKTNDLYFTVENYKIIMTETEHEALIDRIEQYLDENGVLFGFVKELLN